MKSDELGVKGFLLQDLKNGFSNTIHIARAEPLRESDVKGARLIIFYLLQLVCLSLHRVGVLGQDTLHTCTLTVPFSTQEYKWVLGNLMLA